MGLKSELQERALSLGADFFGVASAEALAGAPQPHRPSDLVPNAGSVVVLGMKLLDAQVDLLPAGSGSDFFATSPRQDIYAGHTDFVARELDEIGYKLSRFLEGKGFKAFHQMSSRGGTDNRYLMGLLSLKHAAEKAGLGAFGRSSLLVTPQYGPRVRLGGIVTTAVLEADTPLRDDLCADCPSLCLEKCPIDALKAPEQGLPYQIDRFMCRQYLTTRPACAVCVQVCPRGDARV